MKNNLKTFRIINISGMKYYKIVFKIYLFWRTGLSETK